LATVSLASLRSAGSRSVPFGRRRPPPREEGDSACVAGRKRNPAAACGEEEPGVGGAGASRASGGARAERIGGIFPTAPRLDACRFRFHVETPREESRAGQVGRRLGEFVRLFPVKPVRSGSKQSSESCVPCALARREERRRRRWRDLLRQRAPAAGHRCAAVLSRSVARALL